MFPHAIETPTANLVFESEHIPVSVSLADTFDRELERISAEGADKTVLGNADQARRNLEGEGATKLCAGRLGTIVEKTADDSTGLMQSNTDGGLQLEQV